MMLTTIMLFVLFLLLIGLIAMHLTGWPSGCHNQEDTAGKELRRDLAELRAETLGRLHTIQRSIDELVRNDAGKMISILVQDIERAVAFQRAQQQSNQQAVIRNSRKRRGSTDLSGEIYAMRDDLCHEESVSSPKQADLVGRQLTLFPDTVSEDPAESVDTTEYISVPAADFDSDVDPPYDPDADHRSSSVATVF
ncbi:MAG: hypothetical protein K9I59_07245 [Chlorobium sp.]|uniref:hypothetical protein n=1 Tax=Chlorobium sp. TaxID=1095 RepID=UPI0025B8BC2E|nr:hypothetical protein [Chlorobium sp.]MCF8216597.1 hypothetical protein [Chlorobium sp.]MCF8271467.1 hypothetical protein [Chlorobium sp.]MCF8287839.1 hypothetical protein [Chlorobium sp.]MCF8291377.1 hypothetical protein [Chlorobium sp.]MCF8385508.1 hypothetical protein [Chlorobium sp.]